MRRHRASPSLPRRATVWLALALVFGLLASWPARADDTAKYCTAQADNVVVYIDRTTNYDDTDKRALVDGVSRIFGSLKGGERISVRTIVDNFGASTELVDSCVPFCDSNGLMSLFTGTCTEGVAINDKNHLRDSLVRQLKQMLDNYSELPYSEILRTIAMTAPTEVRPARQNRFYLFTDLIENSAYMPGRSFFNDKNPVLIAKVEADQLIPDLGGAQVAIFGVGRSGKPERPALEQDLLVKLTDFWKRYFALAHATVSIEPSLGGL